MVVSDLSHMVPKWGVELTRNREIRPGMLLAGSRYDLRASRKLNRDYRRGRPFMDAYGSW